MQHTIHYICNQNNSIEVIDEELKRRSELWKCKGWNFQLWRKLSGDEERELRILKELENELHNFRNKFKNLLLPHREIIISVMFGRVIESIQRNNIFLFIPIIPKVYSHNLLPLEFIPTLESEKFSKSKIIIKELPDIRCEYRFTHYSSFSLDYDEWKPREFFNKISRYVNI